MVRRVTLIAFLVTLETLMYLVSKRGATFEPLVLVALPFASSMAARAIAYLDIFEWLRYPFVDVTPHSSGAGDCVNPKTTNPIVNVIGGLLSCINCAGMWSTVGLVALYVIDPTLGRITIYALGATCLGVIITRVIETIEWAGHAFHELTGALNTMNKERLEPVDLVTIFQGFLTKKAQIPNGEEQL